MCCIQSVVAITLELAGSTANITHTLQKTKTLVLSSLL